jgi:hypothetical protein
LKHEILGKTPGISLHGFVEVEGRHAVKSRQIPIQQHLLLAYQQDRLLDRFLRSVQEVFLKNRKLVEADLYEPPLTVFGRNAVERFFTPQEIRELLDLVQTLAA